MTRAREFESGQFSKGIYEFDTSETFLKEGIRDPVEKPGALLDGDVVKIYRFPRHTYRVVGKRMEGKKLIIKCDRIQSDDILFYVNLKRKKDTTILVGVEARSCDGNTARELLVTIKGKRKWVPAGECDYAPAPAFKFSS